MAKLNKTDLRLRAKRGTESQITSCPDYLQREGELAYATDTESFYISNGTQFVLIAQGLQDLDSVTTTGSTTTNSITVGGLTVDGGTLFVDPIGDNVTIGYPPASGAFDVQQWQNVSDQWQDINALWISYKLNVNGTINSELGYSVNNVEGYTGTVVVPGGPWALGIINSAGVIQSSTNLNCSKTATGTYSFTFNTIFPNTEYIVTATFNGSASNVQDWTAVVTTRSTGGFTIVTTSQDNGGTADPPTDLAFEVGVFGSSSSQTIQIQGGLITNVF